MPLPVLIPRPIFLSILPQGGIMAFINLLMFSLERSTQPPEPWGTRKKTFAVVSSWGQMEASPANGDTVSVTSPGSGILSLYPPSRAISPRNLGGVHPDMMGTKEEAHTASIRSVLDLKLLTRRFPLLLALVSDTKSLPDTFSATSTGRLSAKYVANS